MRVSYAPEQTKLTALPCFANPPRQRGEASFLATILCRRLDAMNINPVIHLPGLAFSWEQRHAHFN
jgi:hypothetical protein